MFHTSVLTKSQDSEITTFKKDAKKLFIHILPTYLYCFYLWWGSFFIFLQCIAETKSGGGLKDAEQYQRDYVKYNNIFNTSREQSTEASTR